jgi:hypothetical protein
MVSVTQLVQAVTRLRAVNERLVSFFEWVLCAVNDRCMGLGAIPSHQERVTIACYIQFTS